MNLLLHVSIRSSASSSGSSALFMLINSVNTFSNCFYCRDTALSSNEINGHIKCLVLGNNAVL